MDLEVGEGDPILTLQSRATSLGWPIDNQTCRDLVNEVEQIDGKLEIRVAHSPVNGPTENGKGTWYLPLNEPVYCTVMPSDKWLVEFTDGEEIVAVVLSAEILSAKTDKWTRMPNCIPETRDQQ